MLGEIITKSGIEDEVSMVLTAIGGDSGIGVKHMNYGFGFGGPTINGDVKALKHFAESIGANTDLISSVNQFNQSHISFIKEHYIQKNQWQHLLLQILYLPDLCQQGLFFEWSQSRPRNGPKRARRLHRRLFYQKYGGPQIHL
mgnify:CR=1 FL=1